METGKKFVWKGHGKEKMQKKGGPAMHTDKNFIRNWFLVCKLGYPRKKMGVEHIYAAGISRLVISPMEILDKTKLFIPKKSCKIIWHLLGMKPNSFSFFYFLPLKIVISCLAPGISTLYLSNIPGKSKSWNSQFRDFTWADKLLVMKF